MSKLIKFIKENYIYIIVLVVFTIILNFPLPYLVYAPGGIKNMDDKFTIEGTTYDSDGSLNLVYVTEYKATIPIYLYALLRSDYEIVPYNAVRLSQNETIEDIDFRSDFHLEQTNQNALYHAYKEAGKDVEILDTRYYILGINDKANSDLKIGDELLKIEDTDITSLDIVKDVLANKKTGDQISITVKRNDEELVKTATLYEEEGSLYVGIEIETLLSVSASPKLTYHFAKDETGSSAGLVTALSIYDALTENDLTNGKKIVCTGTLQVDGSVAEIGSANFKLHAAVTNGADIFLVPKGNYEEVIAVKEEHNYDIEIYAVESFSNALEILQSL